MNGTKLKTAGQTKALTRAGSVWLAAALAELKAFCRSMYRLDEADITIDRFRAACRVSEPASPNAWGALPKAAVRAGYLKPTRRTESAMRPKAQRRVIRVWAIATDAGRRRRVNHDCGGGKTLLVTHDERGWTAFCFRCGDRGWFPKPQESLSERIARRAREAEQDERVAASVVLPEPINTDVDTWPEKAAVWLYKAGIGKPGIAELGAYLHPPSSRVVLPVIAGDEVVYWQAREPCWTRKSERPKYINPGTDKQHLVAQYGRGEPLVLTEDVLSAFRVGHLTDPVLVRIIERGGPVRVWLDPDTAGRKASRTIINRLTACGVDTTAIHMQRDPKLYSRREIALVIGRDTPASVPEQGIDDNTRTILKDFGKYFDANPGVQVIEPGLFNTYFSLLHPKLKPETIGVYKARFKEIGKDPEPGTEDGILERLVSVRTAAKLQSLLEDFDGGEADLTAVLRVITDEHESFFLRRKKHPKVRDRIEDILEEDENDTGFHWRLKCLNESMRPLRGGDFGIIGARVDTGKSSWLSSELTHFASQVPILYSGRERTIIVFNNEGPGKRLKHRLYNAALQKTTKELIALKQQGALYKAYVEAIGGRDLIYVFDVHDYSMSELEDIVKELDPAIVVIDMLDNVQADGSAVNGGTRTDQILEWLYQRARIWAVKYDCAVLATSQLNGEAEGEVFPKLSMLANSKTGKAGAADFVLMIGRSASPDLQNSRFISLPKNKKRRDGGPQDLRREVAFDGPRSLFKDPE
ncbi:hypothetical protein DFQ30_010806 [Apophysomyces sp. BC1015]|nr:hypothetical protein DFQ30_010806 [Apophysomyces sp. BC1015]